MIRWIARGIIAAAVLIPALTLRIDVAGGPLFWPEHPHHGYGYMPVGLFMLNCITVLAIVVVGAAIVVALFCAATGKFDR